MSLPSPPPGMPPSLPPAAPRQVRVDPSGAPWPGLIPLRPLTATEILRAGARLVGRHALVLCLVALMGSIITVGGVFGLLASSLGARSAELTDVWLTKLEAGVVEFPPGAVIWPIVIGGALSVVTTIIVAGLATALAADDALGRSTTARAAFERLRGRWLVLLGTSVLIGLAVLVGLFLLVVPGVIAMALLTLASPAIVLEKSGPTAAIRRSISLSKGFRWRIIGIVVLTSVISSLLSRIVTGLGATANTPTGVLMSLIIDAGVSAFTVPWSAAVVAVLYIDIRMRKENLAATLIRAALQR